MSDDPPELDEYDTKVEAQRAALIEEAGVARYYGDHTEEATLLRKARRLGVGVLGTDADAVVRLRDRLKVLEAGRNRLLAINAAWTNARRRNPEADPGVIAADMELAGLSSSPESEAALRERVAEIMRGRVTWKTNSVPYIGHLTKKTEEARARLEQLSGDADSRPEWRQGIEGHGFVVNGSHYWNKILVRLDVSDDLLAVQATMKRHGFEWWGRIPAWARELDTEGWEAAELVASLLPDLTTATQRKKKR